jgi:hypothetical protein
VSSEEIERLKHDLKAQGVDIPTATSKSFLTDSFNHMVLPAWAEMIFLESGVVSTLLGLALFFDAPWVLVVGGAAQLVPAATLILRRIKSKKGAEGRRTTTAQGS